MAPSPRVAGVVAVVGAVKGESPLLARVAGRKIRALGVPAGGSEQ